MESLFDPKGTQDIIERINKLQPTALSQWGKMTVGQMLEHCQGPLKVAFGEIQIKKGIMAFLFGKMAKKKLVSRRPFDHNLPTAKEFIVKHDPEFENAKAELINSISRFSKGPSTIKNLKHPFFGHMTEKEWDTAQWKHLDHHLRQFGV
ncbi:MULTISPECIES: DUF1569 domain-containing protein [Flavobacterium]|uniref:DUF1569 domain-containing protein n=1 Tax=Flavobacterium TaxID=237 RepID=UPI001FCA7BFF|nr:MULTISPECIES: DUF1569 domain-containing protein [Flavobacterium]UOK42300.1 DUF1569 domain-containing protein [Flavobacterium enshiense]